MSRPSLPPPVVVGVGEALYDILPSGPVLGGAPLNLAVHARQLFDRHGPPVARVAVATRVGDDALGCRLREELAARGLETAAVQRDPARPTGTATVALVDGEPSFSITADAAWDHCAADAGWLAQAAGAGAVCYGTLGSRSPAAATARRPAGPGGNSKPLVSRRPQSTSPQASTIAAVNAAAAPKNACSSVPTAGSVSARGEPPRSSQVTKNTNDQPTATPAPAASARAAARSVFSQVKPSRPK